MRAGLEMSTKPRIPSIAITTYRAATRLMIFRLRLGIKQSCVISNQIFQPPPDYPHKCCLGPLLMAVSGIDLYFLMTTRAGGEGQLEAAAPGAGGEGQVGAPDHTG